MRLLALISLLVVLMMRLSCMSRCWLTGCGFWVLITLIRWRLVITWLVLMMILVVLVRRLSYMSGCWLTKSGF